MANPATADVIIVGAGIMGVSTAYHLARRRAGRIVVLERDDVCSDDVCSKGKKKRTSLS